MSFYYKMLIEKSFYHFPFMDKSTQENSFRAHIRKAISLELLQCFHLTYAINPAAEPFGDGNIKGKPYINLIVTGF